MHIQLGGGGRGKQSINQQFLLMSSGPMTQYPNGSDTPFTGKEKWSQFDLKSWVTGGTKIRPEIDSILRVKLTLNIESIWLQYSPITQNPGSNFSSASDSTFWVKMTPFFFQYFFLLGSPESFQRLKKQYLIFICCCRAAAVPLNIKWN